MSQIKKIAMLLCAVLALFSSAVSASQEEQKEPSKVYISQEALLFQNGSLFIDEGSALLRVETLHQDGQGLYYTASLYGDCPNGHPYTPDGGCTGGHECPYS